MCERACPKFCVCISLRSESQSEIQIQIQILVEPASVVRFLFNCRAKTFVSLSVIERETTNDTRYAMMETIFLLSSKELGLGRRAAKLLRVSVRYSHAWGRALMSNYSNKCYNKYTFSNYDSRFFNNLFKTGSSLQGNRTRRDTQTDTHTYNSWYNNKKWNRSVLKSCN